MKNFIQPYNPDWKIEFEKLKQIFNKELQDFEIEIQHVGSTSITGLHAKPILDIDIIINDKKQLGDIAGKLEKLGYISKGEQGISGRFAFRQSSKLTPSTGIFKNWQEHHLYVCFSDSLALRNHLMFRDILLQDHKLAEEYSQLKIDLANEKDMTREIYTERKTDFILKVLAHNGLDKEELDEIKNANV
ncbi:MAG: GrpB family protein [Bacteroidota bacterium]